MVNQQEILDFLAKNQNKWFSTEDLKSVFGLEFTSKINNKLSALRRYGLVDWRDDHSNYWIVWYYKHKSSLDIGHGGV